MNNFRSALGIYSGLFFCLQGFITGKNLPDLGYKLQKVINLFSTGIFFYQKMDFSLPGGKDYGAEKSIQIFGRLEGLREGGRFFIQNFF